MGLGKGPGESGMFEEQLVAIERSLDTQFGYGKDLRESVKGLRALAAMNKWQLETYLSGHMMISLNDEDYARLQVKISKLLEDNLEAARKQGVEV